MKRNVLCWTTRYNNSQTIDTSSKFPSVFSSPEDGNVINFWNAMDLMNSDNRHVQSNCFKQCVMPSSKSIKLSIVLFVLHSGGGVRTLTGLPVALTGEGGFPIVYPTISDDAGIVPGSMPRLLLSKYFASCRSVTSNLIRRSVTPQLTRHSKWTEAGWCVCREGV
jgi:hypothetical protein